MPQNTIAASNSIPHPIVINATNLGRVIDGIGTYTLNLLRELARVRTDAQLVIYVNRTAAEHLQDILFPPTCEVRWVSRRVSPDYKFRGHLLRLLFANILPLRHPESLIFATSQLEAMLFRSNQILTIHDVTPFLFRNRHRKQFYYYKYVLRSVMRRARGIITPSTHTKDLLVSLFDVDPGKISVIHNGVQPAFLEQQAERDAPPEKFILYAGRVTWVKNIEGILRAFSLLVDRLPHRLVIAGDPRTRAAGQFSPAAMARLGIPPERVILMGHVPTEVMVELFRKASVLVFPSFHEGFGLPPLEGMSCGCPVVVSDTASLPEVCGEAAVYVDPHDARSIASGIERVLTDDALREDIKVKGRERARLFSWRTSAREHLQVFRSASAGVVSPDHRPSLKQPAPALWGAVE